MKKLLFAVFILAISAGTALAQPGNRNGKGGAQMREMMREKMKTELQLTDAQTDSVQAVQHEFQLKTRSIRQDSKLSEDEKKTKLKELNLARKANLKSILSEEQMAKLEEMMEKQRNLRQQRQGNRDIDNN